jgi:hypothetical protein
MPDEFPETGPIIRGSRGHHPLVATPGIPFGSMRRGLRTIRVIRSCLRLNCTIESSFGGSQPNMVATRTPFASMGLSCADAAGDLRCRSKADVPGPAEASGIGPDPNRSTETVAKYRCRRIYRARHDELVAQWSSCASEVSKPSLLPEKPHSALSFDEVTYARHPH